MDELLVRDVANIDGPEDMKGLIVGKLNVDGSGDMESLPVGGEENEGLMVDGLNVNEGEDKNCLSVEGVDKPEGNEGVDADAVESVGVAVCPWQLPLVIETSSMATSPVQEDPAIPSNVT